MNIAANLFEHSFSSAAQTEHGLCVRLRTRRRLFHIFSSITTVHLSSIPLSKKSPVVSAISVVVGIVLLAGGAAKVYRGINTLSGGSDPKVAELLKQNDTAIDEANKQLADALPRFQQLLNDFDSLGLVAFRNEKKEIGEQITQSLASATNNLKQAVQVISEALQLDDTKKIAEFLKLRSTSYEKLTSVCEQNIEIVRVMFDESLTDTDAIVAKVMEIATSRDENQKASDEAGAAADAMLAELTK